MLPVVSVEQMRRADSATIAAGTPSRELMRRAGKGLFLSYEWPSLTGILVGGGNNGGDGYALAAELRRSGRDCIIWRASPSLSIDGAWFREQALAAGAVEQVFVPDVDLSGCGALADCLLGTGFSGLPREPIASAIQAANRSGRPIISADINSGLNGDTGEAGLAIHSALTISIGLYKTGLLTGQSADYIDRLKLVDIGIAPLYEERWLCVSGEPILPGSLVCPAYVDPVPLVVR